MNRHFIRFAVFWTLLFAGLIGWRLSDEQNNIVEQARIEARSIWDHNLSYRKWATQMGGIYVRQDKLAPNPYLKVPDRDKMTTDGIALTLVNPAYMTHQVFDIISKSSNLPIINRIVSDKYLNPQNKPDEWEASQLEVFYRGVEKESYQITTINDLPYFRFMRPMITEEGCLKCHGVQGYKVGDIRGGISVAIPMQPYFNTLSHSRKGILIVLVPMWAVGMLAFLLYFIKLNRTERALREAEAFLLNNEVRLKELVAERTKQLSEAIQKAESANRALDDSVKKLEEFNETLVGREMRIIGMKKEVNALCRELGKEAAYPEAWEK